jgi:hypothetical protein
MDEPEQANVVLLWKDRKVCVLFCVRNILYDQKLSIVH